VNPAGGMAFINESFKI